MVFLDRPVLDTRPDFTNVEIGQADDFLISNVAPGAGTPWKATTKMRRSMKLPFLFGTKSEWRAFRDFIATAKGAQQGFWVPSWVTDYDSYENTQGTTIIKIPDINLNSVFVADEQFAFLALIDQDKLECYEIANITILGNGDEQLNLAQPIAGSFNPTSCVCCALLYCRVAADGVKYRYLSDGVVRAEIEFEELPREYVTPHLGSTPIYLYEFTRAGFTWRMTNWPEPLVLDAACWSPDNIKHGAIRSGVEFLPEDLQITLATDHPEHPIRYYLNRSAFEVTNFQIFETNAESFPFDRTAPIYKGRVGKADFRANAKIEIMCSSMLRLAEQQLPRMQMQRTCNHRFGDVNCGVSLALYEIVGPLLNVTTDYVEATEFATEAATRSDSQWFALGKVTVGIETRMIVGQSAGKLYLDEPFNAAGIGDSATAVPGCNKRVSHCGVGRYNNIANAAMFPYAPNGNPQFEALLRPKPQGGKKG